MAKTKEQKLRTQIKNDLLDQLARNGTEGEYFIDLVSDYINMWDTKNKLVEDIKRRGVSVESYSSAGVNLKKNDSVDQLIKLNAQMLKLLDSLGIKPSTEEQTDGEGIDL